MICSRPVVLGLCALYTLGFSASAQQEAATPPQVLQITLEMVKPGKQGMVHDKSESTFVAAMARAKEPTHYTAFCSLSGRPRCIYLTRYDSFAAWESDQKFVEKNAALAAELDRAAVSDGELLEGMTQVVYTYDKDLSYHSRKPDASVRFLEALVYRIKPGHTADWHKLVQMVKDGHEKAGTSAHWGMYEIGYGTEDGTYLVLSAHSSLADIDTGFEENKKWLAAMGGPDGMKQFDDLVAATIDQSHSELYAVNPRQSYVEDSWIQADPAFWKPKPAVAPAAKPAAEEKKSK